jgi:hydroxylamine reductase (hybrid-cluster protein)
MFCYHCQEAKKNVACDTAGICGKKADVSSLHDLLTYTLKGLSFYAVKAATATEPLQVSPRLIQHHLPAISVLNIHGAVLFQ